MNTSVDDIINNDDNYDNNNIISEYTLIRELIASHLMTGFLERDSSYMLRILQDDKNNMTPSVFYFICNILSDTTIEGSIPESLSIPFIKSLNHPLIIESICLHIQNIEFNSNDILPFSIDHNSDSNADIYDISIIMSFIGYEGFTSIVDTICEKKNAMDVLNSIFRMSQNKTFKFPKFFTKKHLIYLFEKFIDFNDSNNNNNSDFNNITTIFEDLFTNVNLHSSINLEVEDIVKFAIIYFKHYANNTQRRFEFTRFILNFNVSEQTVNDSLNLFNIMKKDLGKNILTHIIKNFL